MSQARFGEILGKLVKLSRHDVDEILEHQTASRHRFGEIALSWGLCQPEDVWQAWCEQLLSNVQKIDLDKLGIDAQAVAMIDRETAYRHGVIAIRCLGDQLIIAVAEGNVDRARTALAGLKSKTLRFVNADPAQITCALAKYYPVTTNAA